MRDVYIVEAVRSPIGRRRGDLATLHPGDLLGFVQKGALERRGIDPTRIDQVIGGCVSQVGEQSFNIARCAWLSQGLPLEVPQTTIDSQCGSSQQATTLAMGLVGSGMAETALTCGLEMMTRVPLGANMQGGSPLPKSYFGRRAKNSNDLRADSHRSWSFRSFGHLQELDLYVPVRRGPGVQVLSCRQHFQLLNLRPIVSNGDLARSL